MSLSVDSLSLILRGKVGGKVGGKVEAEVGLDIHGIGYFETLQTDSSNSFSALFLPHLALITLK
jgi:hypothetical protein